MVKLCVGNYVTYNSVINEAPISLKCIQYGDDIII